ncbi:MAG: sulfatase-like hydrolase/transferase [Bacteroidota bacterium]
MPKRFSYTKLILFLFILGFQAISIYSQEKPNILVVVVDDAGYADWGFQGSTIFETPNVDQLVSEGTYFSQAYVTGATCSPSRAGLLTGRYQNRFGFEYNTDNFPSPGKTMADVGIDPSEKTLGNYMQELGYNTAAIGKMHVGDDIDNYHPNNRGFDYFYGLLGGSRPYFHTDDLEPWKQLMRNFEYDDLAEGYMTDVLTDEALLWIKDQSESSENPFFTYLSYTAVHGPYTAKQEDFERFDGITWPNGKLCNEDRQNCAGMAYNLDQNVGKLIDSLKNWGIYDNTLLFFINDNGGKKSKIITDNGTLFEGKGSPYEGGYRVPFLMVWPGHIHKDTVYTKQVISLDIAATMIKAAGGELPQEKRLDGVDLIPVLHDSTITAHEYLFWRKYTSWAVAKKEEHKIIIHYGQPGVADEDTAYYKLKPDGSGEKNNLYNGLGDPIVNDLIQKYNDWESEMVRPYWLGIYVAYKFCGKPVVGFPDCPYIYSLFGPVDGSEVESACKEEDAYGVFPNFLSSDQDLTINIPEQSDVTLIVYDSVGKMKVKQTVVNQQVMKIAELGLESGVFFYGLYDYHTETLYKSSKILVQSID